MSDPRELLEAYATRESGVRTYDDDPLSHGECTPEAIAALRAVLALHEPEVQLMWPDPDKPKGAPMGERLWCKECSHYQGSDPWPCLTVQTILTALEAT